MEFGDDSDEPCTSKEQGSIEKYMDADCCDAPREGEGWLIVKRISHCHHQKIWHGILHSSPLMEEGGMHMCHGHN